MRNKILIAVLVLVTSVIAYTQVNTNFFKASFFDAGNVVGTGPILFVDDYSGEAGGSGTIAVVAKAGTNLNQIKARLFFDNNILNFRLADSASPLDWDVAGNGQLKIQDKGNYVKLTLDRDPFGGVGNFVPNTDVVIANLVFDVNPLAVTGSVSNLNLQQVKVSDDSNVVIVDPVNGVITNGIFTVSSGTGNTGTGNTGTGNTGTGSSGPFVSVANAILEIVSGTLEAFFIDIFDSPISTPTVPMTQMTVNLYTTHSTGGLARDGHEIRVFNPTNTPSWSLTVDVNPGAVWSGAINTMDLRSASGGAGLLTVNAVNATVVEVFSGLPANDIVTPGGSFFAADSVTLAIAGVAASASEAFDINNIILDQEVPPMQAPDVYSLDLMLTFL